MALTFPNSPTHGDTFADSTSGITYFYNSVYGVWEVIYYVRPVFTPGGGESGSTFEGALDFSDANNSAYLVLI
jgi:hypothetical protein